MIARTPPNLPNPIGEVLDRLVDMASEGKRPSFRDMVKAAGLDPRQDSAARFMISTSAMRICETLIFLMLI
jgi:hypothetical protein